MSYESGRGEHRACLRAPVSTLVDEYAAVDANRFHELFIEADFGAPRTAKSSP
jgi:hypothetical protein